MKMVTIGLALLLFLFSASSIFAHSGRTDSSGGHNCSAASQAKGLCSGYHYHNGGSLYVPTTTYESIQPTKAPTPKPTVKPTATPPIAPTPAATPTDTPTNTAEPSPTPQVQGSSTIGDNVLGELVGVAVTGFLGWKALKFLGRKAANG